MKILLNILIVTCIILTVLTLLFGMLGVASGHKIPAESTRWFWTTLFVLVSLNVLLIVIRIKRFSKHGEE
jgi:hypothetical protein